MNPEFEDDKIRRWQEPLAGSEQRRKDPAVIEIDIETEEPFESRTYGLGRGARDQLADTAARSGIPFEAVMEFGKEMSFKFIAKRRHSDGLITYILVFAGTGERHLLAREEWVAEEVFRRAVTEFEAVVLSHDIVNQPLIVGLEEWRRYEMGLDQGREAR